MNSPGTKRLRQIAPSDLTRTQRKVYDAVIASRVVELESNGGLPGPFNAMLHSPEVGYSLQALGAQIRATNSLSGRSREIATLAVAAHFDSRYEWARHAIAGRALGLSESELDLICGHTDEELDDSVERAVLDITRRLLTDGDLSNEEYQEAIDHLGEDGLVTLSTLVGYYSMLAMQMRIFRVDGSTASAGLP
jgi:4-carboxymuconolactone decarboxylase